MQFLAEHFEKGTIIVWIDLFYHSLSKVDIIYM